MTKQQQLLKRRQSRLKLSQSCRREMRVHFSRVRCRLPLFTYKTRFGTNLNIRDPRGVTTQQSIYHTTPTFILQSTRNLQTPFTVGVTISKAYSTTLIFFILFPSFVLVVIASTHLLPQPCLPDRDAPRGALLSSIQTTMSLRTPQRRTKRPMRITIMPRLLHDERPEADAKAWRPSQHNPQPAHEERRARLLRQSRRANQWRLSTMLNHQKTLSPLNLQTLMRPATQSKPILRHPPPSVPRVADRAQCHDHLSHQHKRQCL